MQLKNQKLNKTKTKIVKQNLNIKIFYKDNFKKNLKAIAVFVFIASYYF